MRTTKAVLILVVIVGLGVVGCGQQVDTRQTEGENPQVEDSKQPSANDEQPGDAKPQAEDEKQPEDDQQEAEAAVPVKGPGFEQLSEFDKSIMVLMRTDEDEAMTRLDEAIRLNPDHAKAYLYRGGMYMMKEDFDKAIADCTEMIRIDPDDAKAHMLRGGAYVGKGDRAKAMADFKRAMELDPTIGNPDE